MKTLCKRLVSLLLVLTMLASLTPAAFAADDQDDSLYGDVTVTEEMADALAEQMFGAAGGEAVKTENGYRYQVPVEYFSSLTDQIPTGEEAASEEDPNRLPEGFVDNSNEVLYALMEELEGKAPTLMAAAGKTKVDVVFIIDSTGSMGDEISNVKSNVSSFASYLASKDISLRLGLIDYEDITCDGDDSTIVHAYGHSNWMNVSQFLEVMTEVELGYGGDAPETPIDAMAHLTNGTMSWASDAYRFAVLITDADYKTNNNHGISGMDDMITRLQKADIQVTTITPSGYYTTYGNLAGLTGGVQINLYGDFAAALREYADAVIGGANDTQDYTVRVAESSTKLPVKNATISWDGGSVTTNAEGMAVITTRNNPIRNVTVTRAGYETLTFTSLDLTKGGMITLSPGIDESDESADDVPVLKPSHFQDPKSGSGKFKGPSIELLGKDFGLLDKASVEFEFDLFGANVSISHDRDDKKYDFIIAKEFEGKGDENSGYWEDSYKQYKAIVQSFSDKSAKEIYNQFRSLRKAAKSKADMAFPADVYIGGYGSISYASGELGWDTIEGGVVIGASSKDIDLINYPLPPAPYVFFKVTFTIEGKAEFAFITIESTGKAKLGVKTTLTVEPSLAGSLNLGVDKLASVGGGIKGTLKTTLTIPFDDFSKAASVDFTGSFFIELKLLGFKVDDDFPFTKINIYPGKSRTATTLASLGASDFTLIRRPAASAPLLMAGGEGLDYYRANTYADTAPQLVQLTDGSWLLVWLDAAPERSDNNMSALYFSFSADGSTWSEPRPVSDDGTGDFMPSLALAGNGTPVVAWQNSSVVYADDAELTLETRAKDIEIAVAVFDAETCTFGEAAALTAENEVCEMAVQVAAQGDGAAVFWIENTANSLLLAEGANSTHSALWDAETGTFGEAATHSSGDAALAVFTAGEVNGEPYVAYAQDGDSSIRYINTVSGTSGTLTTTGTPSDIQIINGRLFWSDDAGLSTWDGIYQNLESDALAQVSFTMVPGGADMALFTYTDGMVSELFAAMDLGSVWSNPVPVTDYGMHLGSASAVLENGVLHWAVGRSVVDAETGSLGVSDLAVDSYTLTSRIVVSEEAFVSVFSDMDADTIEVSVDMANSGLLACEAPVAAFYRDGVKVGESVLYRVNEEDPAAEMDPLYSIEAGETVWTIANYPLPEDGEDHDLEIRITDAAGETEYGTARVRIPGRRPDLTITDAAITRTADGARITASVLNNGKGKAENVTVSLTQEGASYTDSAAFGDLMPGASAEVEFTVPADTLTAAHGFDYKRFTLTASTTTEEFLTGDNDADVLLAPVIAESITLVGDRDLTIDAGNSYTYTYTLQPAGAVNQLVAWMSSDTSILTVDNGVITAKKPGTAKLTVLGVNSEGQPITDSVFITVNGDVEISATGVTISGDKTDIKVGETAVFTATVSPADATTQLVEWLISDEALVSAAISPDTRTLTLTGLAEGTVEVVARTIDGGYPSTPLNLEIHKDLTASEVSRIAGADRIGTSLGIADQLKQTLGVEKFDTVIVASALNFPDALTGSYLAAMKSAPILLTYEAANTRIRQYIETNLADGGTVYILGGSTAVSDGFESSVKALGRFNVERLAGTDRFGTNIEIMEETGGYADKPILIATAVNFADSLSASAAGLPMVLVYGSLKPEQKDFLRKTSREFIIIGGTSAVSTALENELKTLGTVTRLAGAGRYQTSVMVAERFVPDPDAAVLAYARNFPDGLCGGPLAYALNAPLILTDNYDPSAADTYVKNISIGFVVGGTGLISDVATRAIFDLSADTVIH